MKILIGENHNLFRAAVAEYFRNFYPNAEISRAYDFLDVFDKVKLNSYDLIFLDAGMSGMTGLDTMKILLKKNIHLPEHLLKRKEPVEAYNLTQREREVLLLLSKGVSNKEIAQTLGLQVVTIKMHLRSICKKLGVKNRTQAAIKALEFF